MIIDKVIQQITVDQETSSATAGTCLKQHMSDTSLETS